MASRKSPSQKDLFNDFLNTLEFELPDSDEVPPFHKWVKGVILDGKPFTYDRHEYLIEPYQDHHLDQSEIKATQMGLTSKAMLLAVYLARYEKYRGILYFFPSAVGVQKFCSGRLNPLIADNEEIGSWLKGSDSVTIMPNSLNTLSSFDNIVRFGASISTTIGSTSIILVDSSGLSSFRIGIGSL